MALFWTKLPSAARKGRKTKKQTAEQNEIFVNFSICSCVSFASFLSRYLARLIVSQRAITSTTYNETFCCSDDDRKSKVPFSCSISTIFASACSILASRRHRFLRGSRGSRGSRLRPLLAVVFLRNFEDNWKNFVRLIYEIKFPPTFFFRKQIN